MEDECVKQVQNYVIQRTLGKGTFGKVKLAYNTIVEEYVAVKMLEKKKIETEADLVRVQREVAILRRVNHPNIIQLYEILESETYLYLVMEYAKGGELFDYIVKKNMLTETLAQRFFVQLINAVEYLHYKKIVHRDLKPENLLLDEQRNIKVADFGLSNTYNENEELLTACGSPCYAAPEMLYGKPYGGIKSDIWSCGIILYAMLCGFLPFEHENTKKLYEMIKTTDYDKPHHLSFNALDLLKKLLAKDPNLRIGFNEIKTHPFFIRIAIPQNPLPQSKDQNILKKMADLGYEQQLVLDQLSKGKHNSVTAMYFLLLKKHKTLSPTKIQNVQRRSYFQNIQNACNYKIDLSDTKQSSTGGSTSIGKFQQIRQRNSIECNIKKMEPYTEGSKLKNFQNSLQTQKIPHLEVRQKAISVQEKNYVQTSPDKNYQISAIQSRKDSRQRIKLQIFAKKNTTDHGNRIELTEENPERAVRNKTQPLKKNNEMMERYNKQASHQIVIKSVHQSPNSNSNYSRILQNSQINKLKTVYKPSIRTRHHSNNDNVLKVKRLLTHNFV